MPFQVWYGVYFSGGDVRRPALPDWARCILDAKADLYLAEKLRHKGYQGADLIWVHGEEHYGLAVPESVVTIARGAGELVNYPVDTPLAAEWSQQLACCLMFLEVPAPTITWYAGAVR